jgi:hypothetical protein
MTVPFFIEEPITWKKVEVPQDILYYCDMTTYDADREDLRYIDCVWMHMGYYGVPKDVMKGVPKHVMKAHREEFNPPVRPVFE